MKIKTDKIGGVKLSTILKIVISLGSLAYITHYFFQPNNAEQFLKAFRSLSEFPLLWAILAAMSLVNWSLEAWKWKILLAKHEEISFIRSFAAVWAGVAFGLFTLNRTGEYVGRMLFVNKKPEAAGVTIFGNIAQLGITVIMGLAGLFFSSQYWLFFGFELRQTLMLGSAFLLALIVLLLFVWNPIKRLLLRFHGKVAEILSHVFAGINKKQLMTAWSLSLLRYLVFWGQFLIVLTFLTHVPIAILLWTVPLTYMMQTTTPTFAFAEAGVRTFAISAVFMLFQLSPEPAVMASLIIWMINVIFPAMCGAFLVYFSDHKKALIERA